MITKTKFMLIVLFMLPMLSILSAPSLIFAQECSVEQVVDPETGDCIFPPDGEEIAPEFDPAPPGSICTGESCRVADLSCGEADNPESDNIVCQLERFVGFLNVGVAVVATITVTVSGFQYMASRGDPNKTAQAINRLIQVGVAIVAYVFGALLLDWLLPGTGGIL